MVKLSVSKAAKMLGISRFDIQAQINSGKLQTHEGYVTVDSLRLAYPSLNFDSEQDKRLKKMQQIKDDAIFKVGSVDAAQSENEKALKSVISTLKTKLYKEEIKIEELTERLAILEEQCHSDEDKAPLHQLQDWVGKQH